MTEDENTWKRLNYENLILTVSEQNQAYMKQETIENNREQKSFTSGQREEERRLNTLES